MRWIDGIPPSASSQSLYVGGAVIGNKPLAFPLQRVTLHLGVPPRLRRSRTSRSLSGYKVNQIELTARLVLGQELPWEDLLLGKSTQTKEIA